MSLPLRFSGMHICILVLICAHSGLSLALPSVTQAPGVMLRNKRADAIATIYGFFDSLNSYGPEAASDDPGIARIPEFFMAIAQQTDGSLMSPLTSGPTPTQSLEEGVTAYPSAPPYGGPGLVVVSSQQLPAIGLATQLPTAPSAASSSGKRPSKRALIFGSVIGALLLFTLFMFIALDPAIAGKLCGICSRLRKTAAQKVKEDKTADKDSTQWVDVVPLTNVGDETFVEGEKSTLKLGKEDDTLLEANSSQPREQSQSPASKFSICSSEYSDSHRNSALSSNSALTSNARKSTSVTFSPGPTPARPPRPPTADSPALSESVYLANACSDQPYVVVAPQPITEADTKNPPRRIMTPSEFFALHAPDVLKGFRPSSSSSSKKHDNGSTSGNDDEPSSSANRESGHSRTKSAPLLTGPTKTRSCTPSAEFDSDDSSFQGPMIQRITRHRRSRSASGWAYPDRPTSRK